MAITKFFKKNNKTISQINRIVYLKKSKYYNYDNESIFSCLNVKCLLYILIKKLLSVCWLLTPSIRQIFIYRYYRLYYYHYYYYYHYIDNIEIFKIKLLIFLVKLENYFAIII